MGNEVAKEGANPKPQPAPRQRQQVPFPSRPTDPLRSTTTPAPSGFSTSQNMGPESQKNEGFVYVETIPRPVIPSTSTTINRASPAPVTQVSQIFSSDQTHDNSDNDSVISEVSSVGNYRENHYRGRGGKGKGFVQRGGVKKNYQQNHKTRVQKEQIVKEVAKAPISCENVSDQLSETNIQEDTAVNSIEKGLKNTKLKQEIINILLLGETGVGKSTFINSIVNYLSYESFEKAEKEKLHILISSSFTEYDKDGKDVKVTLKNGESDVNEDLNVGNSATQQVKTYTFTIRNGEIRLRLIDTPGIGDTRGIQQDEQNCQNILDYISQLHHLHAICYLFKPSEARATAHFKYCITQMFFRLEKSACNNLVFLFTNTRGGNFTPGETYSVLKDLAEDIAKQSPDVKISVDNKFCIDNEAFRYLAGVEQGVQYTKAKRAENMKSWQKSSETCTQLIDHILKLKPHLVNSTMSINECRRHIIQLTKPMAEITLLIEDNISQLDRHRAHMMLYKDDLAQLQEKLYVPVLDVEVKKLFQPVTVCSKCAEPIKLGKITKWHYEKKCCPNCPLRNVPQEIIGSPELTNCEKMTGHGQSCTVCGHHYKQHLHIYYETQIVEKKQVDSNVRKSIEDKEALIETAKKTMENMETRKKELEEELSEIIKYNAKFAYFLQKNALASFSDSYEEYIQHTITGEKHSGANAETISSLEKILKEHREFKKSFAEAAEIQKRTGESDTVTPVNIQKSIQNLYKLKHFGDKIKDMYHKQTSNIKKEYLATEYIHREVFKRLPHEKPADVKKANPASDKLPKKKNKKKKETGDADAQNVDITPTNQGFPAHIPTNQGQPHGFQGQSREYTNQFNKNRGFPNNRKGRGFQRGRGGANRNNYAHRSRSRGPAQGREAPPPYDVAVRDPPYSSETKPNFHPDFSGPKGNYPQDAQAPMGGPTIQVNVTLPPPDSSRTEPSQYQKNYAPPNYPPPPLPPREHHESTYSPSLEHDYPPPTSSRPGEYPPNTYPPSYPPVDSRGRDPPKAYPKAPPMHGTPQYDFRPPQGTSYAPSDERYDDPRGRPSGFDNDRKPSNYGPEYGRNPPNHAPRYDNERKPPNPAPRYDNPPNYPAPRYDNPPNNPAPRYNNPPNNPVPKYDNPPNRAPTYDNPPDNHPRYHNSDPKYDNLPNRAPTYDNPPNNPAPSYDNPPNRAPRYDNERYPPNHAPRYDNERNPPNHDLRYDNERNPSNPAPRYDNYPSEHGPNYNPGGYDYPPNDNRPPSGGHPPNYHRTATAYAYPPREDNSAYCAPPSGEQRGNNQRGRGNNPGRGQHYFKRGPKRNPANKQ